jgi:Mrp family chromosome partitioning ATPase
MNLENGAAHPFYRGKLACGLDDALALEKRGEAQVQENLYVVQESTNGDKLPRVLPRRFTNLLPKLKASDYDYIIFDMPPISQVSVTPRLSRFMDMVLTVVECEKTDRHLVQDATGLLVEGGADVGIVLNKRRQYVPRALHQEL